MFCFCKPETFWRWIGCYSGTWDHVWERWIFFPGFLEPWVRVELWGFYMMATRCCHVWNRILTFSWKENTQLAREVLLSNVDTKRNTQWALHYFHHHHIRSGISSHMTCNYHATWVTYYLGGRFKYLLCLPLTPILREMIQFDAHIFQMLCNHQLARHPVILSEYDWGVQSPPQQNYLGSSSILIRWWLDP